MKVLKESDTFESKKGCTQDTVYIHAPDRIVDDLKKIDLPVTIFKHQKNDLLNSLKRIDDSEIIVLYFSKTDGLDTLLPLLFRSKNQFSTELFIYFASDFKYKDIVLDFLDGDKESKVLKAPKDITLEIVKFFQYLS